ncbi:M20 aminoacylase family protein [Candidatus Sodalis sp. SoCistrobi]|uniref:M20 aminoacylase family protein n=1 Tax=Candidatus Sodalis sp. SoCistrobi TaxID=1922216 RepID=UPI00094026C4|nr:M20 aminoacylase family protein [Candidatus Sodalis sp. SoCistrobi]
MRIPDALIDEAIRWRHQLHAIPELGYQETLTAGKIAGLLESFGLQVHTGLAGTGVVAMLENGPGPAIGLRADMDALPIAEISDLPYQSRHPGRMHACGHDGHSAILLGAARSLCRSRQFSGTLYFIFQPAEENLAGARAMIDDGLFRRFPMQGIYGLHNWPGLPAGHVGINHGAMMASLDTFEITLTGRSCHAAMPEMGNDPLIAAAHLLLALQTITARHISPMDSAVLSVTQINGGVALNVIPDHAVLRGTFRCLQQPVRNRVKTLISDLVASLPPSFGVRGEVQFSVGYPVTRNHAVEAEQLRAIAVKTLGAERVHSDIPPSMASEDFAFMLEACPGAYFWLGADGATPSRPLHNASYDFNDALIGPGIALWHAIVETLLPQSA